MAARLVALIVAMLMVGCSTAAPTPKRIALLAPFEGRYREVGYDALYAVRLALQDADIQPLDLLPIDDGGTIASATDRARALNHDPQVQAALVLGLAATAPETLSAFADIPVVVIGDWGAQPEAERVFILTNPQLRDQLTVPARTAVTDAAQMDAPFTGGEIVALDQFADLRQSSLTDISILSSAMLPDAAFTEQYHSSDTFAPEPGLLAALAYDAARLTGQAIASADNRQDTARALTTMRYEGLHGVIQFENGYWQNAPIHTYRYADDGTLHPLDDIIEQG
ncbi:MAG: hypothetical protein CL610_05415 [Anaerolineaceae bacterium]|nr:hypothetical protein [Anaerolineaceae bacterium]